jgi:hypothetical protein
MHQPQFVSREISFALEQATTAEELRLRRQLRLITNDVLRLGGLGYVCGIGQGGGRADINAGIRQAALGQAWSALQAQFQAAGALDRLTVTAHGFGSAQVLWPVPASDHDRPDRNPRDSAPTASTSPVHDRRCRLAAHHDRRRASPRW